jgi:hypothetical protein
MNMGNSLKKRDVRESVVVEREKENVKKDMFELEVEVEAKGGGEVEGEYFDLEGMET